MQYKYNFRKDDFWRKIPAWASLTHDQFFDHKWQLKNSITKLSQLNELLPPHLNKFLIPEVEKALQIAPMNIRITPYIFALIDWQHYYKDPLRKQFLPMARYIRPDHPNLATDPLAEETDSAHKLIVHRYPDKVLFLPLTVCPVYCTFCTRSRLIGGSTQSVEKDIYGPDLKLWQEAFEYIRKNPQIEDVVVSGGDSYLLSAKYIHHIGKSLLEIPTIRRIRFASKGLAILPSKIIYDHNWYNALADVVSLGKKYHKQVALHTHFNHPNEISQMTLQAVNKLHETGIIIRNQSVLLDEVNNEPEVMLSLIKHLSYMNIQPYYIYLHDMVKGCEHLRTTLQVAINLERVLRGQTAGFYTPTIVCDLPGGGGKRSICSFDQYDPNTGISEWSAPGIKPGKKYYYYDPLHKLPKMKAPDTTHVAELLYNCAS